MRFQHLTLLATLFLFGCSSDPDQDRNDTDADTNTDTDTDTDTAEVEGLELIGLDFVLDSSIGFEPVVGTDVLLGFQASGSGGIAFSLYADCNSMDGDMTLEDGVMKVDEIVRTDMGCEEALMTQDQWLADFVSASPSLLLDGDTLTLTGSDATLIFLNADVVVPDQELVGSLWTIDTYLEGQAATNFNLAQPATLLFKQDGTLNAFTGCNDGGGNYKYTDTEVTFSDVYYTRMACADPDVSRAEDFMFAVVGEGTSSYRIDGKRLTIEMGDVGLSGTTP